MPTTHMRCPICDQRVILLERLNVDSHGQTPSGTFAQLATHSRKAFDETGREWDILCPQSSSPSSTPMLHRD